jgi:hypothetical protein
MIMREISLIEIKKNCSSPENAALKKQIRVFVRSKPGYNPERKRPRKIEEAKILDSFSRK